MQKNFAADARHYAQWMACAKLRLRASLRLAAASSPAMSLIM